MSKKEKRQNSKVIQHDLVKKVFVRYPGLSLVAIIIKRNFYRITKLSDKKINWQSFTVTETQKKHNLMYVG